MCEEMHFDIPKEKIHTLLNIIKVKNKNYTLCKTICLKDNNHFMYYNEKENIFSCPICKFNGLTLVELCSEINNKDTLIILEKILRTKLKINTKNLQNKIKKKKEKEELFYEINNKAMIFFQEQLKHSFSAIEYLKKRGIFPSTIKLFNIGYAPKYNYLYKYLKKYYTEQELAEAGVIGIDNKTSNVYDVFKDRIIFPIINESNNVIGFGGRALNNKNSKKYINTKTTPIFTKSKELYAFNMLSRPKYEKILISEGYMDVISLYQQGIDYVVGTLGTAFKHSHYKKIIKKTKTPIIMFDGDMPGITAIKKILKNEKINSLILPEDLDPDDFIRIYGKEEFVKFINKNTKTWGKYWLEEFKKQNKTNNLFEYFLFNIKEL